VPPRPATACGIKTHTSVHIFHTIFMSEFYLR
jgi:hypothetical protein